MMTKAVDVCMQHEMIESIYNLITFFCINGEIERIALDCSFKN
jgi:hypothetical protein